MSIKPPDTYEGLAHYQLRQECRARKIGDNGHSDALLGRLVAYDRTYRARPAPDAFDSHRDPTGTKKKEHIITEAEFNKRCLRETQGYHIAFLEAQLQAKKNSLKAALDRIESLKLRDLIDHDQKRTKLENKRKYDEAIASKHESRTRVFSIPDTRSDGTNPAVALQASTASTSVRAQSATNAEDKSTLDKSNRRKQRKRTPTPAIVQLTESERTDIDAEIQAKSPNVTSVSQATTKGKERAGKMATQLEKTREMRERYYDDTKHSGPPGHYLVPRAKATSRLPAVTGILQENADLAKPGKYNKRKLAPEPGHPAKKSRVHEVPAKPPAVAGTHRKPAKKLRDEEEHPLIKAQRLAMLHTPPWTYMNSSIVPNEVYSDKFTRFREQ